MVSIKFFIFCGAVLFPQVLSGIEPYKCCRNIMQCYRICKVTRVLVSVENIGFENCTKRELTLHDEDISSIAPNAFKNLQISELKIKFADKELDLSSESFNGLPFVFSLEFISGVVPLKVDMFKEVPNLEILTLILNGTKENSENNFLELKYLSVLKIHHSNLGTISIHTFLHVTPSIRRLELIDNNITRIEPLTFIPLKKLKSLVIKEKYLNFMSSRAFDRLSKLESLEINGNQLNLLEKFRPIKISKLRNLQISGTEIKNIRANIFSGLGILELSLECNKIEELDKQAFSGLNRLLKLSLYKNNIKSITHDIFKDLRNLKELYLGNNEINEIEDRAFFGLKLEILSLKNNNLSVIKTKTFEGLEVDDLDLKGNNIITIMDNAFENCQFVRVDRTESLFNIKKSTRGLENMSLNQYKEMEVQKETHGIFPNLIFDDGTYTCCRIISTIYKICKISNVLVSIEPVMNNGSYMHNMLSRFPLVIEDKELSSIAPNAFRNLTISELEIEFSNTELNLTSDSFNGLPHLTSLTFSSGVIPLKFNLFKAVKNLHLLSLSINGKKDTLQNGFSELEKLSTLKIFSSHLEIIGMFTFHNLDPMISDLELINNGIVTIGANSFSTMTSLQSLTINENNLQNLDSRAFDDLDNLNSLTIIGGQLTSFSKFLFDDLQKLQYLKCSGFPLNYLEPDLFSDIHLATLTLEDINITKLETGIYSWLDELISLSLDENKIEHIPINIFSQLKSLGDLSIDSNRIKKIDAGAFSGLDLEKLSLRDNKLTVLTPGTFEDLSVVSLDLTGNNIMEIQSGVFLHGSIVRIHFTDESFTLDRSVCNLDNRTKVIFKNARVNGR